MTDRQALNQAYKQIREIVGRSTGDEGQTVVDNKHYCFRKDGKAWILIEVENLQIPRQRKTRKNKSAKSAL